jgi:hypothetical protein
MKIGQVVFAAVNTVTGEILETPDGSSISEYKDLVVKDIEFAYRLDQDKRGQYSVVKVRVCYGAV